jgi:hypothetical protein
MDGFAPFLSGIGGLMSQVASIGGRPRRKETAKDLSDRRRPGSRFRRYFPPMEKRRSSFRSRPIP